MSDATIRDPIAKLPERAATGSDGVPSVLLKKCAVALMQPLLSLWEASWTTGTVPEKLKEGIVAPIFKGGNKSEPSNYRTVVLTSHVSKLFERVVAGQLVRHLELGRYISPNQHGFRQGRSCSSQLLQHYYDVLRGLESGCDVDVIYLDFSKAFDKVDLGLLLCKLRSIGVVDSLITWIKSFLLGRRQRVVVDGHSSHWNEVVSGVPQGTILGPILFLAHIMDIEVGVESTVSSFADDTRLMRPI